MRSEDSADKITKAGRKYRKSKKGKFSSKKYWKSESGKLTRKRYSQSEKSKLTQRRYYYSKKGQEGVKRRAEARIAAKAAENWLKENPGKTFEDYLAYQQSEKEEAFSKDKEGK